MVGSISAPAHGWHERDLGRAPDGCGLAHADCMIRSDADVARHENAAEFRVALMKPGSQLGDCLDAGGQLADHFAAACCISSAAEEEEPCHPPVTDMCRSVAGLRRSILKSWPLGRRAMAASIAA